jgi:prepilin-type N-terminal cleavage/methylation domain-containing protein
MRRHNRGFTLLEVSMVMSLVLVAAGVGVVQIKNSLTAVDANTAGTTVVNQLRYAREIAVNQRRNVTITFNTPGTIVIERQEPDNTLTTIETTPLPSGFSFSLPTASVGDTPDGYGGDLPVDFSDGNTGTFLADGTFVNGSGIVLSGTVFTRGSSDGTARAVTLSGTNGITTQYYIRDGAWIEKR